MISSYRTSSPARRNATLLAALGLATCAIAGCGDSGDTAQIGVQSWGDFAVAVEVRPAPPRPGHNEIVVVITGEHHRPVYDALVWLRVGTAKDWVQAIEDGHLGVYRRAVAFSRGPQATLQVRLQRADVQSMLEFPVTLAP